MNGSDASSSSTAKEPSRNGAEAIQAFLSHLANERNVAASIQNQALSAILFLCKEVLKIVGALSKLPLCRAPVIRSEERTRGRPDQRRLT